jgi:hypothetical protein
LLRVRPLFESTKLETEKAVLDDKCDKSAPTLLTTASGNVTLEQGQSKVIIQTGSDFASKLKTFSGTLPVPPGQVDFRTWYKAAQRLHRTSERSTSEVLGRIQNSLCNPALEMAQSALDSGSVQKVLQLLKNVYGDADDPQDLWNKFHATMMTSKEKTSEYLNRLYLLVEELRHRGLVKTEDTDATLLKQFVYGCSDDHTILKLRLEDEGSTVPDFGTLLLAVRKEEAKRSRRQGNAKQTYAACAQHVVTEDGRNEIEELRKEVASLKSQLTTTQASLRPTTPASSGPHGESKKPRSTVQAPKLRFCFKCGMEGHVVWTCKNSANPELVSQKFDLVKRSRSENM